MKRTPSYSTRISGEDVLNALPGALRDAPQPVQRAFFLRRARQYAMLIVLTYVLLALLALHIIFVIRNSFTIDIAELSIQATILVAMLLAATGLERMRTRSEAMAEFVNPTSEDDTHDKY